MITTVEGTPFAMFAVARQIPNPHASTHAGKWKVKFMGVELTGKTLGVIQCGQHQRDRVKRRASDESRRI
jgi:phosphoglycerate dehydrogenase-like enzyme